MGPRKSYDNQKTQQGRLSQHTTNSSTNLTRNHHALALSKKPRHTSTRVLGSFLCSSGTQVSEWRKSREQAIPGKKISSTIDRYRPIMTGNERELARTTRNDTRTTENDRERTRTSKNERHRYRERDRERPRTSDIENETETENEVDGCTRPRSTVNDRERP